MKKQVKKAKPKKNGCKEQIRADHSFGAYRR